MRLIDADAIREKAHKLPNGYNWGWFHKCVDEMIDTAPTIDAIPVVRCKDCEFYTEEDKWCRWLGLCGAFDPNDYCSHAERRDV